VSALGLIRRLRRDGKGAVAIEFALVGPAFIVMLLGVLQVGIALQNYNALRNVSADVARYAMVQYSTGNNLSNSQLRDITISTARGAPYLLTASRMNASVTTATTQRVSGATELTLNVTYQIPTLLDSMGLRGPYITYNRPIFLTDNSS
jgi:Flp pilus assembly protein TadG